MIDDLVRETEAFVDSWFRLILRVQDEHESGAWDSEHVYCRTCGPPTDYPCEIRQWAERSECSAPESVKERWRSWFENERKAFQRRLSEERTCHSKL